MSKHSLKYLIPIAYWFWGMAAGPSVIIFTRVLRKSLLCSVSPLKMAITSYFHHLCWGVDCLQRCPEGEMGLQGWGSCPCSPIRAHRRHLQLVLGYQQQHCSSGLAFIALLYLYQVILNSKAFPAGQRFLGVFFIKGARQK